MYDPDAIWLWLRLLLKANHKETEFMFNGKKVVLSRGQLITGRKSLVDKHRISESKVFRLLKLFENEHLIEQQKTNRYSIITIVCYNQYQDIEQQIEQPVNNQRTTSEQPVNTSKELIIHYKNDNNIPPSLEDVTLYCKERNKGVDYNKWHDFYTAKGWMVGKNKMKNWKAAIRTWEKTVNNNQTKTTVIGQNVIGLR